MRRILFFLIVVYTPQHYALAQGLNANNAFNNPPVSIMSPDVAGLGSYGEFNINYYTGSPNISIPITELKEPGISIPIETYLA